MVKEKLRLQTAHCYIQYIAKILMSKGPIFREKENEIECPSDIVVSDLVEKNF